MTDTPPEKNSADAEAEPEQLNDPERPIETEPTTEPEAERPIDPEPTTEPGPERPRSGYPPPAPRRLYRSRQDQKLGGVAAGLAEFLGVDPTIVRLATLLLAFTGVGILIYVAAWIIVPVRPEGHLEPPPSAPLPHERSVTFALGIAAIATAIGIVSGSWMVLALALIGGGVWLLSEQTVGRPATAVAVAPHADPSTDPYRYDDPMSPAYSTTEPSRYTDPMTSAYSTTATRQAGPPPPIWPPSTPGPVPREPRRPQKVTWIVISLLALLTGVGMAAAAGDWWNVSATRLLGIGLVVIGVGVVVGQIRGGGARGLIPLFILAALALFPVAAVDGLVDDGVGDSVYRPTEFDDLEAAYRHGVGQLTVDLSAIDFDGRDVSVDIDLGIGELNVVVPDDVGGSAALDADVGEISYPVAGSSRLESEDGLNVDSGIVRLGGDNGTLELDIHVGIGAAELRRAGN